jgi:hypothetical protein
VRSSLLIKVVFGILGVFLVLGIPVAVTGTAEDRRTMLGVIAVVAFVAFLVWIDRTYRVEPRRRAMAAEARRLGLRFTARDRTGIRSMAFDLLRRPAAVRDVTNVVSGTWRGVSVTAFEFRWANDDDEELYTCVIAPVPVQWPSLVLKAETGASLVAQDVGLAQDIELEWEEFNRAFRVRSPDRRFAISVLDPRMMAWLLGLSPRYGFEVADGRMLAYTTQVYPWEVDSVLTRALEFRERVPDVTFSLFGGDPPPRPDEGR